MATPGGGLSTPWNGSISGSQTPLSPWKSTKRTLKIDFDDLEKLLSTNESESDSEDRYSDNHNSSSCHGGFRQLPKAFPCSRTPRLVLHSSSTNSIFHATHFKDLGRSGQLLRDIFAQNPEDAWWLDMQNPSEREVRQLCAAFNIHPLTLEDILARESSEKIEEYPSYRFTCIKSFHEVTSEQETTYEAYIIYMVVFSGGTLSFCFDDSEHSTHVEERITKFEDFVSIKSDWIFYAFVDDIVDSFGPTISRIEKRVNQIVDQVYTARDDDMKDFLWEIEAVRRQVLSLMRLLGGKSKILRAFENHHCVALSSDEEIKVYINDVQDHVSAMMSNLRAFEGLLSRSKSSYLAQLEISNSTDRFRVFRVLSRMAVISLILTFLTLISNMFSMNTSAGISFFTNDYTAPWFIIIGADLILALSMFYVAKKWRMWW